LTDPVAFLPQQIEIFSAFRHTLSDISLSYGSATSRVLVVLINYFANLVGLYLRALHCDRESGPFPPLSRPLEKPPVTWPPKYGLELFDELSRSGLRANEVIISCSVLTSFILPKVAKRVTDAFGANTKSLRLLGPLNLNLGKMSPNPAVWNSA